MPVDASAFRSLMGSFPTGIVIVTTLDEAGAAKGLTTQSFISVSTAPPLLLVSLDRTSRTLKALLASGAFVVNFLAADRGDLDLRIALQVARAAAIDRLKTLTPAERARIRKAGQSTYSAYRVIRRMLEHEWEHRSEIAARLGREV